MTRPGGARWLTVQEIAEALRVSDMTVYRLVHSGELTSVQIRNTYRIKESSLLAYLNRPQSKRRLSRKR